MISVVDDDPMVRESTIDLLNSLGYAATAFESGEDFLDSVQAKSTSCVITDLHLPGISGIELQEQIKLGGNPVPVIFITAFPEVRVQARAFATGAVAFLTKPFEEGALISSLEAALDQRRA